MTIFSKYIIICHHLVSVSLVSVLSSFLFLSTDTHQTSCLAEYNVDEHAIPAHRTYRSPVSLLLSDGSISRVPQTNLSAFQVWRVSSTSVRVRVGAVSPRTTSSVPPLSAAIPVPSSPSIASSPTTTTTVSVTHNSLKQWIRTRQCYPLMLAIFFSGTQDP